MGFWGTARDVTFKGLVVVGTAKVVIATAPILAVGAVGSAVWTVGKNGLANAARRRMNDYDRLPTSQKTKAFTKQLTNTALGQVGGHFTHGVVDHIHPPTSHH